MTGAVAGLEIYALTGKRVWVAGHTGMVGSAVVRALAQENCEVLKVPRADLDLRNQADVTRWVGREKPDAVIVAGATVGGILANDTRPAEFIYDNMMIATNIVDAAHRAGVGKLLYLGSSCIYPRSPPQPIVEDALLTAPFEPTNQWYATAKVAGIMLCRAYRRQYGCDFISAMPTNSYGPNDTYDLRSSHVIPALISKMHTAKAEGRDEVEVWGTGKPRREFIFVEDLADALVFLLKHYSGERHVNIGVGSDVSIRELAETIAEVVGAQCRMRFDTSKADGPPQKLLDSSYLFQLGWKPSVTLTDGLQRTYRSFLQGRIHSSSAA
ncbi:GDP-L-fucose synthase [Bradyrhizobium ivorense]|nr:GDP-L-fucose synthase [Bradyrhizobium ivorense]